MTTTYSGPTIAQPTPIQSASARTTPPPPTTATPTPNGRSSGAGITSGPTEYPPTPDAGASARDQAPPATKPCAIPTSGPSLADPLLVILADAVDDLERTRIANENRLRQLTRVGVDKDGQERGFGLDEGRPEVARLRGIVEALKGLEHDATLGLARQMRAHPLGRFVKATPGLGEKQTARLLSTIGDPFWHTLYDRPRTVSELWAFCGLHVLKLPGGHWLADAHTSRAPGDTSPASQEATDTQKLVAGGDPSLGGQMAAATRSPSAPGVTLPADQTQSGNQLPLVGGNPSPGGRMAADTRSSSAPGDTSPASRPTTDAHPTPAGGDTFPGGRNLTDAPEVVAPGDLTGDPDQNTHDTHPTTVGVAAKRRKGVKSNWSAQAKMRAYLVAVSCMKTPSSPYRPVYDDRRAHTAITRPAWTAGHSHNDALRVVAKAVLRDLWREAKAEHERHG